MFSNVDRLLRQERSSRALTGYSPQEIQHLLPLFTKAEDTYLRNRHPNRQRAFGGGARPKVLVTPLHRLVFVLTYLKVYPTYDLPALMVGLDKARVYEWVQRSKVVLSQTLAFTMLKPRRRRPIGTLKELFDEIPELREFLVDATEQPIRRPKNKKKERKHYSGKAKRHTIKRQVVVNKYRRIVHISTTVPGSMHDYQLFKETGVWLRTPPRCIMWADSGYEGARKDLQKVEHWISHKRKAGRPLSVRQREEN